MIDSTSAPTCDRSDVQPPRAGFTSPQERRRQLEAALADVLNDATDDTKAELRRLSRYEAPPSHIDIPKKKLAAVLVLLHLNPVGQLSVTLTTRSRRLRSHPGETALPGGKWEEGDGEGGEWTALREAHEEIGLPLPTASSQPSHLLHLTTLPAFTSRTLLVVIPVVYLLLRPAAEASQRYLPSILQPNPDEVDAVFHLPLQSFLLLPGCTSGSDDKTVTSDHTGAVAASYRPRTRSSTASSADSASASAFPSASSRPRPGTEALSYTYEDFVWLLSRPYRLHSFSHPFPGVTPSAVTGLTADICIETAVIARYGAEGRNERQVGFERYAEGQMEWGEIVETALGLQGQKGLGGTVGSGTDQRTSET
ncbi:hypothetical protein JCM11641_006719 [Rhodosporidiobolus odoratus]